MEFKSICLMIFYFTFLTPIAMVARTLGRDRLRLKQKKNETYWILKEVNSFSKPTK